MADEFQSSENFSDGQTVNAARLNAAFNGITILPSAISNRTEVTPDGGDYALLLDISTGGLAKAKYADIFSILAPVDGGSAVASRRTLGTGGNQAAPGNDARFGSSVIGLRKGNGAPNQDAVAMPPDVAFAPGNAAIDTGASSLDCSDENRFVIALTENVTLTVINVPDGGTVKIQTTQDGTGNRTVDWTTPGLIQTWEGGTPGVATVADGSVDLFILERFGTQLRMRQSADYS